MWLQQLPEEGLELDAVQHWGAGGQGAGHGFLDKIHCPGGGVGQGLSPEEAAQKHGGEEVAGWRITPLEVRDADTESLDFGPLGPCNVPCFRRGYFDCAAGNGVYLDVSGWGMGEVWINGRYLGAFWDEEKQQSIRIPDDVLETKGNRIVVFDIRNNDPDAAMRLSDKPVFK